MIVTYNQISYSNNWVLNPLDPNGDKYFEAKLYSSNVYTTSNYINFDNVILFRINSILPNNLIVMSFNIPEYSQQDIQLIPVDDIQSIDDGWTAYRAFIQIPKNKLSYTNANFQNLIVPASLGFACNEKLLSSIQNQLETYALKSFLDDLYETNISFDVSLDSYFKFANNYGSSELYDIFPSSTNAFGEKFNFSWISNYYMNLSKAQSIENLFEITASIPLIMSNMNLNFYYHTPRNSGYKVLTYSEKRNYSLIANETHTISLPFKVTYDEVKKELVKDLQNGHNFLLPEGGNGYYEINFDIQTKNSYYKISGINNFNYLIPLNDLNKLDFFVFNYFPINTLNGFTRV
ncbi:DUF5443 family protein [Mycoplasmoides alvi]|uniref:DUF5443 family protein n=1 Tax=Mycoplasmoides alvi TaxID=78580 RepID=UPI00051C96E4|nr:DUF5443 family protein [Mycoplasmoides alvi]